MFLQFVELARGKKIQPASVEVMMGRTLDIPRAAGGRARAGGHYMYSKGVWRDVAAAVAQPGKAVKCLTALLCYNCCACVCVSATGCAATAVISLHTPGCLNPGVPHHVRGAIPIMPSSHLGVP